eukprot:4567199-Ditylum_brightwellii.AAC.1
METIVGSVVAKSVSLGTWNKKSGDKILNQMTRKIQSKTSNYSIKKLFTSLDRHWDMCYVQFCKPSSLKGFLNKEWK